MEDFLGWMKAIGYRVHRNDVCARHHTLFRVIRGFDITDRDFQSAERSFEAAIRKVR